MFNEAVVITSHSLLRLLAQHHYLIGVQCELLTHYRGCNDHIDGALLFFIIYYYVSNRFVDVDIHCFTSCEYPLGPYGNLLQEYHYVNSFFFVFFGVCRVALAQGQCRNFKVTEM